MLSSVLNSEQAIQINIQIMNTFVQMRNYVLNKSDKTKEIEELKTMLLLHIKNTDNKFKQTDKTIQNIINVLNNFIEKPRETKHIGF